MTLQISTPIHYLDERFEILDSNNVHLFDPKKLSIECTTTNTSNWKGYKCEYAIKDGELYLINFEMHGSKANQDLAWLNFLTKESFDYQVKAEIKEVDDRNVSFELLIRSDQFYFRDIDFKIQNAFLIAKERRVPRQLSASRGDLPWYYKDVHLVRIKDGRLLSVENFSNEFYQFFRLFTDEGLLEEKYRKKASEFLTENLGVKFNSYFTIIE
jgi:hypothetical protein